MKHNNLIAAGLLTMALSVLACTTGASTPVIPTAAPAGVTSTPAAMTPTVPVTAAGAAGTAEVLGTTVAYDAACGTGPAKLPTTAPRFADFAATILATLNERSSSDAISQGLRDWGSITDQVGGVYPYDDLTGDGSPELIVIMQAPQDQFPQIDYSSPEGLSMLPGDLYVYGCAGGKASLLFADYSTIIRITPHLVTVADINADKVPEVVYTTSNCGANTCYVVPHVIGWNTSSQKFLSLFPENYAAPSGKLDVTDVDGDGISEIIVHVGFQGSAGAGVQRSVDDTYAWDGTQYTLKTSVVTSPQYPIHLINDADSATVKGDYAKAIGLYQQVIDDPNPKTWRDPSEAPALKAYARYRLMLAYTLSGDAASAQTVHDALATQFASTPAEAPGASFAQFANLFWDAFQPAHDVKAGCAPVIALAASNDVTYSVLNSFGYANALYKPEDLCPAK